ncbi:MAG: site-specific DNA-methyltransferase, partial [Deltaproteobacteria bacterium]|nr:site-specific DNA-methyltransferase [Deltaproteobacteria bacterium]
MGHFNGYYENIPLDNKTIDQSVLNILERQKTNPLPWNGQFSPQLVQILLDHYSKSSDIIYDPFLGSGTTLLEAGEQHKEAYGTEINYAAVCLSKIYEFINYSHSQRLDIIKKF